MPQARARFRTTDNQIVRRLKAGNGKIAGLHMLAAVDDVALMAVVVIGIDFYGKDGYGGSRVLIKVRPDGGYGHLWIPPANLIDNTTAAIDLFERKAEAQTAYSKMQQLRNDRARRSFVLDLRAKMTAAQRKEFDAQLPDRLGEKAKADPVAAINRATGEYELNRAAELATKLLFDVLDADVYED